MNGLTCGFRQTFLAAVVAAFSAQSANAADPVRDVRAEIASNSVVRIPRGGVSRYYNAWYVDNCTEAEREAILARNIAAHRRWMALAPKDACAAHADLGETFAIVGRWKEAKTELAAALAAGDKLDAKRRMLARWDMANCLWLEGDREGAKKLVAEVAAMYGTGKVSDFLSATGRAKFLAAVFAGQDEELDFFKLPHSVEGKPFPTPQEAQYGEGCVSLAHVVLKVKGLGSGNGERGTGDGPIVKLLKRKLGRFGTKFCGGALGTTRPTTATVIEIAVSPDAPVEKPQGYSLEVVAGRAACPQAAAARWGQRALPDAPYVRIAARTRLGATWGVVSLIQCVDRGGVNAAAQDKPPFPVPHSPFPAIRECRICDWPKCERRGVVDYWVPDFLEFALFNKMSSVTLNMGREYTLAPLDRECNRLFASRMRAFGIETYFHIRDIAMKPMLPLTSKRTWDLHLERARFYASIGAGISFHLDDHRFPMHPADLKAAGTAANLDAKYMTRLYRAVKKEYPDAIMQFCPPFYWGPDGGVNYPEDRDTYLKSVGADLDPGIDVYWTGPRVKTHGMTIGKTKWYSDLIGRKPTIFHNGNAIGQHNYIQYGADPTGYKKSHAPEIFDHIASFQQNMSHYSEACEIGSAMDWCWNPEAHDGATSVRRAIDQLEGPGVSDIIAAATPSLAYFDKYGYCEPRAELLDEDQDVLDRRVAAADAAWAKVKAVAKNGGMFVNGFKTVTGWGRRLANIRRTPPEALKVEYASVRANASYAVREAGYDEAKGDQFIPAELLVGGRFLKGIRDATRGEGRSIKMLETGMEASGRFTCEPFPNPRPFKMIVAGMRYLDRWERPPKVAPTTLELEVNGRIVWRGPLFADDVYRVTEIEIPVDALERKNTFTIRNPGPYVKDEGRPVIHYVVVRK